MDEKEQLTEMQVEEKKVTDSFYEGDSKDDDTEVSDNKTSDEVSEESEGQADVDNSAEEKSDGEDLDKDDQSDEEATKEEYDLKLKEDSYLDNSAVEEILSFAKENNLTNEQAQKLLSRNEESYERFMDAQEEEQEKQLSAWRQEVVGDSAIGGEHLERTKQRAQSVVKNFASEEMIEILRETGYGDNPAIVKFLEKIGAAMEDDKLISSSGPSSVPKSTEDLFYGKHN